MKWPQLKPVVRDRVLALVLGGPAWTVLGIARSLSPDPVGHGTHKQLGLGTCSFLGWCGYPCPMCGMTTTFTHMAHFEWWQALKTQPFGVVLFLITAITAGLALAELVLPRGRFMAIWGWIEARELVIASAALAGLFAGWAYKFFEMGGLH